MQFHCRKEILLRFCQEMCVRRRKDWWAFVSSIDFNGWQKEKTFDNVHYSIDGLVAAASLFPESHMRKSRVQIALGKESVYLFFGMSLFVKQGGNIERYWIHYPLQMYTVFKYLKLI